MPRTSYLDRFVGGGFNFDFSVVLLLLSVETSLFVSSIFSDFIVSLLDSEGSESSVRNIQVLKFDISRYMVSMIKHSRKSLVKNEQIKAL